MCVIIIVVLLTPIVLLYFCFTYVAQNKLRFFGSLAKACTILGMPKSKTSRN